MSELGVFPETRYSAVAAVRSDDAEERRRSLEVLARTYYRPVYLHVRLKWRKSREETEDLAQAFFASALDREVFGAYDPEKARFRTFVRVCVDRFVVNEQRNLHRQKRGGLEATRTVDIADLEADLASAATPPEVDEAFEREWTRQLFASAVESLRAELEAAGKSKHFEVFTRYDLHDATTARPTYAAVAAELGLAVTDVTNYLHGARREFRRTVLERLREITGSDEEFREEALALGLLSR